MKLEGILEVLKQENESISIDLGEGLKFSLLRDSASEPLEIVLSFESSSKTNHLTIPIIGDPLHKTKDVDRISYLSSLKGNITSGIEEHFRDLTTKPEIDLRSEYLDLNNKGIEDYRAKHSGKIPNLGKIAIKFIDLISFRHYSSKVGEYLEIYGRLSVAWNIIEVTTRAAHEEIDKSISFQAYRSHHENLRAVSSFYFDFSEFAKLKYATNRDLFDRASSQYRALLDVQVPDIDSLSSKFLDEIRG